MSWFNRPRSVSIDDPRWQRLLADYPFARSVGQQRLDQLRSLSEGFLGSKTFSAEAGLRLTDDIAAAIALQACVPVVELGLDWYDDFRQIIVYPDQFLVERSEVDDAGVVHEEKSALAGETIDGGPVVLSWAASAPQLEGPLWNVVIHEFVHKLDLRDGAADGIPPLPAARRRAWRAALEAAYDGFVDQLDRIERSIPAWIDPESDAADRYYQSLPLDAYAAHDHAEFFAVAGEAFFLDPARLESAFPDFFAQLTEFFRVRPMAADC